MWLPILISALTGYLLGNLNGSVTISTLVAHDDVRAHGSGNAGLTNFFRSFGGWNTLLVALIDIGKTVVACLAGGLMLKQYGCYAEGVILGAVAVSLGHDFPILLGFRGGKGVLCGVVIAAVVDWRIALVALAVFSLLYGISGYVSLGSIFGAAVVAVGFCISQHSKPIVMAGGIFIGALVIFMHRQNIVRLIKGTESKVSLRRKGTKNEGRSSR